MSNKVDPDFVLVDNNLEKKPQTLDDIDWEQIGRDLTDAFNKLKPCECGSDKVGSDRHSTWCQKYINYDK